MKAILFRFASVLESLPSNFTKHSREQNRDRRRIFPILACSQEVVDRTDPGFFGTVWRFTDFCQQLNVGALYLQSLLKY